MPLNSLTDLPECMHQEKQPHSRNNKPLILPAQRPHTVCTLHDHCRPVSWGPPPLVAVVTNQCTPEQDSQARYVSDCAILSLNIDRPFLFYIIKPNKVITRKMFDPEKCHG